MKRLLVFLLLLQIFLVYSQNDRFIYEVHYKKDSTNVETVKENYNLDVNPEGITYYNRIYYINDSIYNSTKHYGFKGYRLTSFLSHKNKNSFYENYEYIGDVNFYKIDEPVNMQWKILDSTKSINELKLQKAETNFGGRKWVAWFAQEIPISYGPYKFNGLPGLIVELYDTKKNYIFKLIKNEKIPKNYESFTLSGIKAKAIITNYKKLNNLKLELYQSPFKYVFNGGLSIPEGKKLQLEDGTILTKEQLKPAEKNEKIKIKSFNNPLELDKAIIYPN
ncbi:GLPGLI family protein [Chryseobacterium schmidteae]|uniref:GLPGLI family protein n=1 Tax=Chryseobacterium schmidteae TaxID=2730404 RepID=UPI00158A25BC|nr:GLPGLI family protein [Chryseobacterium schmidteae]